MSAAPWGTLPTDKADPNFGRACLCGEPVRAGERYTHVCAPSVSAELLAASEQQKAEELAKALARAERAEADFANACDVGRRQEARAEAAESMLVQERLLRYLGPSWGFAFQMVGSHEYVTVRCGEPEDRALLGTLIMRPEEAQQLRQVANALGAAWRLLPPMREFLPSNSQMVENLRLALSPGEPATPTEGEKRDAALDLLKRTRARVVGLARHCADTLAANREKLGPGKGTITSTDVLDLMRSEGHGQLLDSVDRRFMGVVFRRGWEQVGWSPSGSHKRLVPVWRRKP